MKKKISWIVLIVVLFVVGFFGALIYRHYFYNPPSCACALPTEQTTQSDGQTFINDQGCADSTSGIHPDYCQATGN